MKKRCLWIAVILTGLFLLAGIGISHAAEATPKEISPSVVTVAFAHSYNGTTNVTGAAFNLKGANAEIDLEGGVAFCFDTSLGHMVQGSQYEFLGLAQDYSGAWNVDNAYKCMMAAETLINQPKYNELSSSMKLFAVQVAVRKQQTFGPYSGVQATASADVVCNARQSQLMIDLINEIVEKGLSGSWKLPAKTQSIALVKTGGRYYSGDYYVLAEYTVKTSAGSISSVRLDSGTSQGVETVNQDGKVIVRIPANQIRGTVSWNLAVKGTVTIKTLLLFSPASSGYQRMVSLQSYGAEATGSVAGSETFYGLKINKKDGETGALLTSKQAVFKIKSKATGSYIEVNDSTEFVTDGGSVTVPDILPTGAYILEEIKAPEGYQVGNAVSVTIPGTADIDVVNYPLKGRIAITKTGSTYTGVAVQPSAYGEIRRPVFEDKPLAGVRFTIKDSHGITVGELVTDAKGQALSEELPLGKYVVQEAETLPGYILETNAFEIELTPAALCQSIKVYNDYTTVSLAIQKQAEIWSVAENGETVTRDTELVPGEGFVFGLYANDDSLVAVGSTDDSGRLKFCAKLPLGQYYIKELKVPEGYALDDTRYGVDFTAATEVFLTIENHLDVYPVSIGKMDITGENPLPGALVEIYDAEEQLLYREVTGEDGTLPDIRLAPGQYSFCETVAPEGYALQMSQMDFTVNSDGSVAGDTIMEDELVCFQGTKLEPSGVPLPGAKFTLYNEAGEAVAAAISDEKGEFVFQGFPQGKYTVKETKAPEGYYLSEESFSFENDGRWVNGEEYTSHTWTDEKIPEPTPTPTPTPIPSVTPTTRPGVQAPHTGDNTNYMLFVITVSLAIMGIVSTVVVMKREE